MIDGLFDAIERLPRPVRRIAAGLDGFSSTGPKYARQRRREYASAARLAEARRTLYREIWQDAAHEVGASLEELSAGFFELGRASASTRVWFHEVMLDASVAQRLALNKALTHRLLLEDGLPVPQHVEFHSGASAVALEFVERGGPCVVKPAEGTSGGEGATAGIVSRNDFARARLRASQFGSRLLVERQATGYVYRFLIMEGELLDVIRRHPPRVLGDGQSTVAELIHRENLRRARCPMHAGLPLLTVDLDSILTLKRSSLKLSSVPESGALVQVKTVTNQSRVDDSERIVDAVSPELIEKACRAVDVIGLRLAGVDVVTSDHARPLRETGGVIIEVNGTPGLHYHYQVHNLSDRRSVAVPILRRLLEGTG